MGERRSVWDNLRGRKERNGMWERWEIEAVAGGMAEEALNGEREEVSQGRRRGQGPGLGARGE